MLDSVRILLLHTGGTLMMRSSGATPLKPARYTRDLVSELPMLNKIADIDTEILLQLDSSDMQPEDWVHIAQVIHERIESYDGIVLVHGTDTMAYTASALAFLLPDLSRPVMITGSQRPLDRIRSDARTNLVDAFQLVSRPIPEVGVVFASKLFRGCRSTKRDAWGLDAFASPTCPPLAELGIGIELGAHILAPRERKTFDPRIEARVLAVRLFPGLDPSLLLGALDRGVRGIVLKAFGAGNVPTVERSLIPVIERAVQTDVPVVIVSQCLHAHIDLDAYVGGSAAKKVGAVGGGDMTDEAALTKLMITLGRSTEGNNVEAVRDAFAQAPVGEMG